MSARPWYASNARDLLETRKQGLRPDGRVVVSLVGGQFYDVGAITLYVRPDMPAERLDWRMLADLEVWLWAGPAAALQWVVETASRIAHARPAQFALRFEEGEQLHDVHLGTGYHTAAVLDLPAVHTFTWCPLNASLTAVGQNLTCALTRKHARWTQL